MGHERIGFLPHTKQWRGIVDQIASFGGGEISIAQIANETLNAVKKTYEAMPFDESVIKALSFLATLSYSANLDNQVDFLNDNGYSVDSQISLFSLMASAQDYITTETGSLETNKLAKDAAMQAVIDYQERHKINQISLFADQPDNVWSEAEHLIASSVSCSSSRTKPGQAPHCGCCSQCIDRRFSLYAAGINEYDAEYANDFIHSFPDDDNNETKQRIYSTMRLANLEDIPTQNAFVRKYPDDVTDLVAYWRGSNADDKLDEIYDLVCRYGKSVIDAATRMRNKYDDLSLPINKNSLLGVISERQYKKSPIIIRIEEIDAFLRETIPIMFQRERPANENDLNDKIEAILKGQGSFTREHPSLQFWRTEYRPDHAQGDLLIESKYVRDSTTPSKITEGIAADMTKAPSDMGFMFVVYDPDRQISDDMQFAHAFEGKRNDCFVRVYR